MGFKDKTRQRLYMRGYRAGVRQPPKPKATPERRREQTRESARRMRGLSATRPCPAECELCGKPPGARALALDHCHVSGRFRGWLCGKCNTGIGMLGDTVAGLRAALRYLRQNAPTKN